ncbi:hypothetical protein SBV1_810055 [Verrucomicrobia bacterium]|nr:hypothetical protein SBV1_810055 [Verrucomicrobiota bacterium]
MLNCAAIATAKRAERVKGRRRAQSDAPYLGPAAVARPRKVGGEGASGSYLMPRSWRQRGKKGWVEKHSGEN